MTTTAAATQTVVRIGRGTTNHAQMKGVDSVWAACGTVSSKFGAAKRVTGEVTCKKCLELAAAEAAYEAAEAAKAAEAAPVTAPAKTTAPAPEVGMGASYGAGSDSYPATIVEISKSGKMLWIQQDEVIVTGEWAQGEYEARTYSTMPNTEATRICYTLRKNGRWIMKGQPITAWYCALSIGARRYRQDPHF
jgi:hypothetical protein